MRGDILLRDSQFVEVSSIIRGRRKDTDGSTKAKRIQQGTGNWWVFDCTV